MPACLRNEADWTHFQRELDDAALVVTGRLGHEVHPNKPHRRRLVLTSAVDGMERDRGATGQVFYLNPARMLIEQALDALLPMGGRVAVTGGTRVFDAFLLIGFDWFDLARAVGATLPGGRPVFAACDDGVSAASVLHAHGLVREAAQVLDPVAPVTLTRFSPVTAR
jgi:hypothetical protein